MRRRATPAPGESVPWGINVDGNDDVWVGNMWGRSATLLAGDNTAGHPAGTKAGDLSTFSKAAASRW